MEVDLECFYPAFQRLALLVFAKAKFKDKFFKIFSTHHPQKLQDSQQGRLLVCAGSKALVCVCVAQERHLDGTECPELPGKASNVKWAVKQALNPKPPPPSIDSIPSAPKSSIAAGSRSVRRTRFPTEMWHSQILRGFRVAAAILLRDHYKLYDRWILSLLRFGHNLLLSM